MDRFMPQKLPFSKKKLPKRVILSYILDYAIIVVLVIAFYALDAVEPFHQHFSLNNYTLQYPYIDKERVPIALCGVIAFVCPAIIIAVYSLLIDGRFSRNRGGATSGAGDGTGRGKPRMKDRFWELNCGILGLLLSQGLAFVSTAALKNACGKPRPDLIARCQPKPGSADLPVFGLSNSTICEPLSATLLKDGFRSFPSGHASSAWAGLFYLSLYLTAKLHVLDNRGEVWKTFIVLAPLIGAALISISRIMDGRHHPFDIISGSLLGAVVAWCSYRQYFGPVSETWRKGRAYPIRSWATEPSEPDTAALDREVSRTDAVEPLRTRGRNDEEQYVPTTRAAESEARGRSQENVFRQQISQSQLRRQGAADPATYPPAAYASVSESRNPPPARSATGRPRHRGHDGCWSSSEDDNDEGYELRQQYTLNDPHGQGGPVSFGARQDGLGDDTAYHPPASTSQPGYTQPALELHGVQPGRDLAGTIPTVRDPPPQHVGYSHHAESAPRGVDLVETYGK